MGATCGRPAPLCPRRSALGRNSTSQTIGQTATSFTLNDDYELTATSGGFTNSYSYNANGEQTGRTLSGTAYTLGYDYEGQLTSITQGQNTTDFVYDALGRRYSRTAGGTTAVFFYAGSHVLLEKQGDTFTAAYTYGNALLRRNSEYPLFDGHGSERTVTNGSETVTGTINFEAFGQTAGATGSSSSPYMYAGAWGYRTDGDAGLMHVGARYYDAQVGRFITRDTLLSEHPYLYCEHDPVNFVDPGGDWRVSVGLSAGAGVPYFGGWGDIGISFEWRNGLHAAIVGHIGGTDSGAFSGRDHGWGTGFGAFLTPFFGLDGGTTRSGSELGWATTGFLGLGKGVSGSLGWDLEKAMPNAISTWPFRFGGGVVVGAGYYGGAQIERVWGMF